MKRLRFFSLTVGMVALFALRAEPQVPATNGAPSFNEVFDLVHAHLAGVSDADLNRIAVRAFVLALDPQVALVTNNNRSVATDETLLINTTNVFDGNIAYLRISRVSDGLAKTVREAYAKLNDSNKLSGMVLDLRYTGGDDYAAAGAAAGLFVAKEQALLDWGEGVVKSKANNAAINIPVAVLINRQTSGAAEALAAVLRETESGLLLGTRTAGLAMIFQEFPFGTGQKLRVATAPIKLGDGSALALKGVNPDIAVEVSPQDERTYYADAFSPVAQSNRPVSSGLSLTNRAIGTNRVERRPRFDEAELVRERKAGIPLDSDLPVLRESAPEKPLVRDPVLARALDLLKGLAVVRATRS